MKDNMMKRNAVKYYEQVTKPEKIELYKNQKVGVI